MPMQRRHIAGTAAGVGGGVGRQTELLIVHVAALGGRHLPVRGRGRDGGLAGLATVEHDSSRDPAQSGRVGRRVVMPRGVPFARCRCKETRMTEERKEAPGDEAAKGRARQEAPFIKLLAGPSCCKDGLLGQPSPSALWCQKQAVGASRDGECSGVPACAPSDRDRRRRLVRCRREQSQDVLCDGAMMR